MPAALSSSASRMPSRCAAELSISVRMGSATPARVAQVVGQTKDVVDLPARVAGAECVEYGGHSEGRPEKWSDTVVGHVADGKGLGAGGDVVVLDQRWAHHSPHSGYCRFLDHVPPAVARVRSVMHDRISINVEAGAQGNIAFLSAGGRRVNLPFGRRLARAPFGTRWWNRSSPSSWRRG